MKIKDCFIKRKVADKWVVVAVGEEAPDFPRIIELNETSAFLWDRLLVETTCEALTEALMEEYDVTTEKAAEDVAKFVSTLNELRCFANE